MPNLNVKAFLIFFALALAACGGDGIEKSINNPSSNNVVTDAGDAGPGPSDASSPDAADAGPGATCDDQVLNGDESDVDCGGSCAPCENGADCNVDDDCTTNYCGETGVCEEEPLATGEICMNDEECASGICKDFGGTTYCTEPCTDTCNGQNLACFRNECTPNTYCDDPDQDGLGFGPGCAGQPCDRCDADATCSEQGDGSFTCLCNDGFDGDGESCTDVDECSTGANDCAANATCTNTPGSFSCACDAGFTGDGTTCTDIDECATGGNCDVNAVCTNTPGSFSCACDAGFTGNGTTCTDIDECATGADNCAPQAVCTNIPGAFSCACEAGFTGNGFVCSDIDECATGADNCGANADCSNEPGSFSCACAQGFAGDGFTCTDIDECATGADNCSPNATCANTIGGFDCTCNAGYTGDGVTCSDRNECLDGSAQCGANTQCVDLSNGYTCVCSSGYEGDPNTGCTNVNECANGTDQCDPNATCTDTPGNYSCSCNPGYTGNGFTCQDVNECFTGADNCSSNASCSNTVGGFTCSCNPGYSGDGVTCVTVGDTCTLPYTIGSLPFTASGDTSLAGVSDDYSYGDNQCPGDNTGNGNGQADEAYAFVPPTTGDYIIDFPLTEFGFDVRGYVVTDCGNVAGTCQMAEYVFPFNVTLTAGTTYYIIVDGGFSGDEGTYTMEVYEDACANSNPCDPVAFCDNDFAGPSCTCPAGYTGDGFTCTSSTSGPDVGDVVINEIMQNPNSQLDSDGEWFELYNASGRTLDLDGCRVVSQTSVGDDEFIIAGSPSFAAGDYMVFATTGLFAGPSDYVFNGAINLNNSNDTLELHCVTSAGFEQQIDYVAWDDGATFPDPDGASMNLDPAARNTTANDLGSNWCVGTTTYYLNDKGTPGSANVSCP